jgi:hypothetical protein
MTNAHETVQRARPQIVLRRDWLTRLQHLERHDESR